MVVVVKPLRLLLLLTGGEMGPLHAAVLGTADAVHVVALLILQLKMLLPPEATLVGLAVNVIVGGGVPPAGVTLMVTELLTLLHVSV